MSHQREPGDVLMTAATMTTFGALPAVQITSADGAQAIVTLYGAHLVSWKSADGQERLFCSARSALDGSRAIRGGVPVIFPQFGERGSGMRHGFARVSNWRADGSGIADGAAFADFALTHQDLARALSQAWPHEFELHLRIAVRAGELLLSLEINNTGTDAFSFASALHSYFQVGQIGTVRVDGLQDALYSDETTHASGPSAQREARLAITGKIDRVYHHIPNTLSVATGEQTLRLEQSGFHDAVVWNPGAADTAALPDMAADEYRRFICVEAALIGPHLLQPGATWVGRHQVTVL
jgi:glucose-6-phosphate 1-epimerase